MKAEADGTKLQMDGALTSADFPRNLGLMGFDSAAARLGALVGVVVGLALLRVGTHLAVSSLHCCTQGDR